MAPLLSRVTSHSLVLTTIDVILIKLKLGSKWKPMETSSHLPTSDLCLSLVLPAWEVQKWLQMKFFNKNPPNMPIYACKYAKSALEKGHLLSCMQKTSILSRVLFLDPLGRHPSPRSIRNQVFVSLMKITTRKTIKVFTHAREVENREVWRK